MQCKSTHENLLSNNTIIRSLLLIKNKYFTANEKKFIMQCLIELLSSIMALLLLYILLPFYLTLFYTTYISVTCMIKSDNKLNISDKLVSKLVNKSLSAL